MKSKSPRKGQPAGRKIHTGESLGKSFVFRQSRARQAGESCTNCSPADSCRTLRPIAERGPRDMGAGSGLGRAPFQVRLLSIDCRSANDGFDYVKEHGTVRRMAVLLDVVESGVRGSTVEDRKSTRLHSSH